MEHQSDHAVRKGSHYALQSHHYIYIVFPMKYRRSLVDEVVPMILPETASEIAERFPVEMAETGMDENRIHLLCSAHLNVTPVWSVKIFKAITVREKFC